MNALPIVHLTREQERVLKAIHTAPSYVRIMKQDFSIVNGVYISPVMWRELVDAKLLRRAWYNADHGVAPHLVLTPLGLSVVLQLEGTR